MWAYQKGMLWALELPSEAGDGLSLTGSAVPRIAAAFAELSESDADSMASAMGLKNPKQIMRRLAQSRRCFAAKTEGNIVAYGWVSTGRECIGEMGRQIHLQADEAYVWDCVTLPAYRRLGLYTALLSFINNTLLEDGYRRIWIGSNLDNQPSIRGFANAGYQPAVAITHVRITSLNLYWVGRARVARRQLAAAARDALSMESDRKLGPLLFGRVRPADLSACADLED